MPTSFSEQLLNRIKQKYIYQTRFAKEINVERASVSQWVGGKAYPSRENLVKICKALDWDLEAVENIIETEKKQDVLQKSESGAEPHNMEELLLGFRNLPLFEQGLLLKEMLETHYMRKAREGKQEKYFDQDIQNDLSSKKKIFYDREQRAE